MKRNKVFILICFFILIFSLTHCKAIIKLIGPFYERAVAESKALPESGTYFCAELDIYLRFSGEFITVELPSGNCIEVSASHDVRISDIDFSFYAMYNWDQKDNIIFLTMIFAPEEIEEKISEDMRYKFKYVENDA